jgi:hypothetical protein
MSNERYLTLAYQVCGFAVAVLSLMLILLPEARVRATHLCFTALLLVYVVLSVYVDKLQGLTLRGLYEQFRDGRRVTRNSWHTVVLILTVAALWFGGSSLSQGT